MQRVSSHGSLVTPVATPAENDLDDELAVSSSKETADPTGSITHDDVDERGHGEASLFINNFNTDIQRLQWNRPKSKETSRSLMVPVDSTKVDDTVSPSTNNEHREKSLQTPVNEWIEQTGRDNQSYPNGPVTGGGYPEAGTLNLGVHTADEPLPCFYCADHRILILQNPPIKILVRSTLYHEREQNESENVRRTVSQYIKGNWVARRVRYPRFFATS